MSNEIEMIKGGREGEEGVRRGVEGDRDFSVINYKTLMLSTQDKILTFLIILT